MCDVREELRKFKGKEILVDLVGKEYAPKGILKEVYDDFIIVSDNRIIISSIAGFKLARGDYR